MNDVVLYSGGLDSFLVHHHLNKINRPHKLLYFDLGGRYRINEVSLFESYIFKRNIKQEVEVSECLRMGSLEHEDSFIPNRNILAAIMAHSVTGYSNIWIGGTLSDRVNDNNREVFNKLSNLLTEMYSKHPFCETINVTSPFWDLHKPDLIRDFCSSKGWGQYHSDFDAKKALVESTFSCSNPISEEKVCKVFYDNCCDKFEILTKQCMKCPACFRKCMSLFAGGIFVPLSEDARSIVDKYYNEAVKDQSSSMRGRMMATIEYCNYLTNYWSHLNGK